MWKYLLKINKNLIIAIPFAMLLGFGCGLVSQVELLSQLKALIVPMTFLMVYPMMVTLNINHLRDGIKNVPLHITAQLINFIVIPAIAYGLGSLFFADRPYMALGLLLAALLPTSGMTISWTGFAKGNIGAAINMTVIGLTLGSLAAPLYVKLLLGQEVAINLMMVFKQILFIVFLPMLLGFATRQILLSKIGAPEFKKTWAPRFPPLSTIGVLGIVFVAMALKAQTITANPAIIAYIFMPLAIIYLCNFSLSTIIARMFFKRGDAIALVYGTVMRNLSIALAIAITTFGERGADAALVIAAAYIIQVQSAAWYVKFTERIFGPAPESA